MTAVKAVVFDWAGTTIDFGSRAPMGVFIEVFRQFGIEISVAQARGPMGLPKLDHIRQLGKLEPVRTQWRAAHGGEFDDAAAQRIYEVFIPLNTRVVVDYATLVPGAAETVHTLRQQGIRIGSTTGYTRKIMEPVLPLAAEQGYAPDNLVCAEDLWAGRPTPVMMWKCFLDLQIENPASVVKVDDTGVGLAEGISAGAWTVGVTLSGNEVGLSEKELAALSEQRRSAMNDRAREKLAAAGAHYVIDTIADLSFALDQIEKRLARGEKPEQ
jgi:phosphonoacetaldehyde hydrolase